MRNDWRLYVQGSAAAVLFGVAVLTGHVPQGRDLPAGTGENARLTSPRSRRSTSRRLPPRCREIQSR